MKENNHLSIHGAIKRERAEKCSSKKAFSLRFVALFVLALFALSSCAPSGSGASASPDVTPGANAAELSCTLYIECSTILNNMNEFNPDKLEVLPENGIVLDKCTVSFTDGESVYDVMVRELMARKIHMEAAYTPVYDSAYIEGINNLYEFDCGAGSGWTFSVNGQFPNYGCSKYSLNDGDAVEWHYTCDFGADVGCVFDANATPTPAA